MRMRVHRNEQCGRRSSTTLRMATMASTLVLSHGFMSGLRTAITTTTTLPPPISLQLRAVTDPDTLLKNSFLCDDQLPSPSLESAYELSPSSDLMESSQQQQKQQQQQQQQHVEMKGSKGEQRTSKFVDNQGGTMFSSSLENVSDEDQPFLLYNEEEMVSQRMRENPSDKRKNFIIRSKKPLPNTLGRVVEDVGATSQQQPFEGQTKVTTKKKKKKMSRSSTMAGFRNFNTRNKQSYVDSIKRAEDMTGKDLKRFLSKEAIKEQKRIQGEGMYKACDSVPDSLVSFARELHQEERITPKEELELGRQTQEALRLLTLYDDLELKLDRTPTDDEWCAAAGKINMEAIRQTVDDGLEAKNKLVLANLRMVQGVVNIYIRNGLSGRYNAGDLMQEGVIALIRAAEKFEPHRGFRFSTYAMYWIRSAVKRSQTAQSRIVPVPVRMHANYKRVKTAEREMRKDLGRPPTRNELAEAVNMSEKQIERCFEAMQQRCYSLDQEVWNWKKPNESESKDTLYDVVESSDVDEDYDSMKQRLLRDDLIETLYRVLDRECATLMMLRYGLMDATKLPAGFDGPLTIAQVSQLAGMKPDKVRRKLLKSLKDLKYNMHNEWGSSGKYL